MEACEVCSRFTLSMAKLRMSSSECCEELLQLLRKVASGELPAVGPCLSTSFAFGPPFPDCVSYPKDFLQG